MEVNIFKNEKNLLEVGMKGLDKAVVQAIVEKLNDDKSVDFVAYKTTHPLVGYPVLVLKTKRKDAMPLLVETVDSVEKEVDEFVKKFKSAVKE